MSKVTHIWTSSKNSCGEIDVPTFGYVSSNATFAKGSVEGEPPQHACHGTRDGSVCGDTVSVRDIDSLTIRKCRGQQADDDNLFLEVDPLPSILRRALTHASQCIEATLLGLIPAQPWKQRGSLGVAELQTVEVAI